MTMARPKPKTPSNCAQCGADIPPGARACPECGADERTGWDEESVYDGLDLPDPEEESHKRAPRRPGETSPIWMYVALLLIVVFALGALGLARW